MADVSVPSIASVTPASADTLVGVKTGAVKRFPVTDFGPANVKWHGITGSGDETAAFSAAITATKRLRIPSGMTVSITGLTITTDLHLTIETGATLKHFAGSDVHMLYQNGGALTIDGGGTIDGNRANQTGRPDAIRFRGTSIDVSGMTFTGTITTAIIVYSASGDVRITENSFASMAEHGGTTGQGTQAIYIGDVNGAAGALIAYNRITAGTPSATGKAPGGIQVAVSDSSLYSSSCRIIGNYFYQIGMAYASNFLGCVDLYTNAKNSVVSNNVCARPAYIALKLQSSAAVSCTGNVIGGGYTGDTGVTKAMILYQHARNVAYSVYCGVVANNVIDLTGDTTQAHIEVTGDVESTSYPLNGCVVSGNTCVGGARGIIVSAMGDVSITGNTLKSITESIKFVTMLDIGGIVSITGNNIRSTTYGVYAPASAGMTNVSVSIVGNVFADCTTACATLLGDADSQIKAVNIVGNTIVTPPTLTYAFTVDYATELGVYNNAGQPTYPVNQTNVTKYTYNGNGWQHGVRLIDNGTEPTTQSGSAFLYVDTADGDLKVKFGDGTVKTIVVDT